MNDFEEALREFTNLEAWDARIGVGTHVCIEFGEPIRVPKSKRLRGEFGVWITGTPWRLEHDGQILAGSGQDEFTPDTLETLNGDRVSEVVAKPPYFDISINWQSGKILRVFCENTDFETIVFFLPHKAYSVDHKGKIDVEDRVVAKTVS